MSKEQTIVVYGIQFFWESVDATVVKVNNPTYGSVERRVEITLSPEELAHHMAAELVKRGPEPVAGSS